MGMSLSWLAVQNTGAEAVYRELRLESEGEQGDLADFPLSAQALPNGWLLLVARGCDHPLVGRDVLRRVSANCTAVACSIEEHVMFSSARVWSLGEERWSIVHAGGDHGTRHLEVQGTPPDTFVDIEKTLRASQEEADRTADEESGVDHVFDIPLETARQIVGFKHDEDTPGVPSDAFQGLKALPGSPLARTSRSWLGRLLRKV